MIREYLHSKGFNFIELRNSSGLQAKMNCPKCGDKNSFGINLETGAFQCFRQNKCGVKGSFLEFKKLLGDEIFIRNEKTYHIPNVKIERINGKVYKWFKDRNITEKTVDHFKIGLSGDGNSIMFLYHKGNKLQSIKYRDLKEKKFYKEKNCRSILWNQDNVKDEILYITEGETDCMALYQYGIESVSLPTGVNDLSWIEYDWEFLEKFKEIYLIMDNDNAGQSIIQNLANRLGKWKCKNVLLPFKDVNQCLISGLSKEELNIYIRDAKEFDIKELKHCDYYTNEIIEYKNNPRKLYGTITSNIKLTEILRGWRNEELTIWTGQNGAGKSTVLSQEVIHLLKNYKRCCICSFEMPPRKYLWWLIKQSIKKIEISDYEVEMILNEYAENLFIIDILGEINKEYLYDIIEFGSQKYGIEVFIIDSLMKINLTSDSKIFYGEQKRFVSGLKDFAIKYKCHIHLVAHPRKGINDEYIIGKSDVSGAGDITNLADNVIVMHRYTEEQIEKRKISGKENYDAFLQVKKNREHGNLGKIGFYFNKDYKVFELEKIVEYDEIEKQYNEVF